MADKRKVELTFPWTDRDKKVHEGGEVVELDDLEARKLIRAGRARDPEHHAEHTDISTHQGDLVRQHEYAEAEALPAPGDAGSPAVALGQPAPSTPATAVETTPASTAATKKGR